MKLNQNTIETLKNFAGINTNILIKQGDELSTISTTVSYTHLTLPTSDLV